MNSLPDELIGRIFEVCDKEDRQTLALVNKRFHYIHKHSCGSKFRFHIRGRTELALRRGLEYLFKTDHPFDYVIFTKFNFRTLFKYDWFVDSNGHVHDNCRLSQVTILKFNECIVTDFMFDCFRIMFPNMKELHLKRTFLTSDPASYSSSNLQDVPSSPTRLNLFQATVPLYADNQKLIYSILEDHFDPDYIKLPRSFIGDKRWVNQQYLKKLHTPRTYFYANGEEFGELARDGRPIKTRPLKITWGEGIHKRDCTLY